MKKTMVCILAIVLCISLLAGCGPKGVVGRYAAEDGDAFDFDGYGELTVTLNGETIDSYTYAMDGSDILVYEPDHDHVSDSAPEIILTVDGEAIRDKNGKVFTKS